MTIVIFLVWASAIFAGRHDKNKAQQPLSYFLVYKLALTVYGKLSILVRLALKLLRFTYVLVSFGLNSVAHYF